MDSPEVRQLSLSLFAEIKSGCIALSQIALLPPEAFRPDSARLIQTLKALSDELQKHEVSHPKDEYILSTKLADYVFFPISNLLKQSSLSRDATRYVLQIVGFLVKNSWGHLLNVNLLDQLCPLVIFLCGGASISNSKVSAIVSGDSAFKASAAYCLTSLIRCFPRLHFTDPESGGKRLSILGDSTTILLDIVGSIPSPLSQEDNGVICNILTTLDWLYSTRVTAEQTSYVFPGVVSKLVNLSLTTRNVHYSTVLEILKTLRTFIIKVFDDESLQIEITDASITSENLHSLSSLLEETTAKPSAALPISIKLENSDTKHRTTLWLHATSKQLKLSLISFFKDLLFKPTTRMKIVAKPQLSEGIFDFFDRIVGSCFSSLFSELLPSSIDVISTLIYVLMLDSTDNVKERELLHRGASLYTKMGYKNMDLFYKQLLVKTNELIFNQLQPIFSSLNEEKIVLCSTAVKFQLKLLQDILAMSNKDSNPIFYMKQNLLKTIRSEIVANSNFGGGKKKKANKLELLHLLSGDQQTREEGNKLDNIELPPHINANKLTKVRKETKLTALDGVIELKHLAKLWNEDDRSVTVEPLIFDESLSNTIERTILGLVQFLATDCPLPLELIEALLTVDNESSSEGILGRNASLWMFNNVMKAPHKRQPVSAFDIQSFVNFETEDEDDSTLEEMNYLVLERAQDLMLDAQKRLNNGELDLKSFKTCEAAYSTAIESIGILAKHFSKEEFQTDFLMDYLYPLLEALTWKSGTVVQILARRALSAIVDNHYSGSLKSLLVDNSDYLIDSLSLSLSAASGLTPSLPGILLVILKISGALLLQTNQLQDILSEIFIVIDSYHGYSALVENFFLVFEEIVSELESLYLKQIQSKQIADNREGVSAYKPWGLSSREQLLRLVEDTYRQVDPFADYDAEKEYFKRKPGVPFGDQTGDSDDEDDEPEPEKKEEWPTPIPKNYYSSLQQIFTYGLQLLSHPSTKLRIQVLRTLTKSYPLVSSNYKITMPLLALHWPMLLAVIAGTSTMSEHETTPTSFHQEQLIVPGLEFAIAIFREDVNHESFMSRRFTELWEFLKKRSPIFQTMDSKQKSEGKALVARTAMSPKMSNLYVELIITGLNNYEKLIPDLVALEMVKACVMLGIDNSQKLKPGVKNMLWVAKNH